MSDKKQWQPIETAPTANYSRAFLADDEKRVGEGVLDDGDWLWRHNEKLAFPTHWMPLPEAPQ